MISPSSGGLPNEPSSGPAPLKRNCDVQEANRAPSSLGEQGSLWNGYSISKNITARAWLIMSPCGEEQKKDFEKICASEASGVHLRPEVEKDSGDKHYFEPVQNLPDFILDDCIVYDHISKGEYYVGKTISDIVAFFEEESGSVFLGKVDLPRVYQPVRNPGGYFACPARFDPGDGPCFDLYPAFRVLASDFRPGCPILPFSNDDFSFETTTWNIFSTHYKFHIALLLPNYEVSSKIKFADTLNELMALPPDPNKNFPGGTTYRACAQNFLSLQRKST